MRNSDEILPKHVYSPLPTLTQLDKLRTNPFEASVDEHPTSLTPLNQAAIYTWRTINDPRLSIASSMLAIASTSPCDHSPLHCSFMASYDEGDSAGDTAPPSCDEAIRHSYELHARYALVLRSESSQLAAPSKRSPKRDV